MLRRYLLTTALFTTLTALQGQPDADHRPGVQAFIDAVKTGSPEAISQWISYPLTRPEPLPAISNRAEFVSRFYQVFDPELLEALAQSSIDRDWSTVGWRGTCYKDGLVWLEQDGKLRALNRTSKAEMAEIEARMARIKKQVHPSVAHFKAPISEVQTASFRIRLDELDNGKIRYAAWKRPNGTETAPSLVLDNGRIDVQGSGGNHAYVFENSGYVYEVYFQVLGTGEEPPVVLRVYQGERLLSEQAGEIIQP